MVYTRRALPPLPAPGSPATLTIPPLSQSALFNFQSLLLVLLLLICTSAYVHHFTPGIMDRNKNG